MIIGIYSGRFQPFSKHHYMTYKWMEKQFDKCYIATTNKTDNEKSPFDFKEKREIIHKFGIPTQNIVEVKNPYNPIEITHTLSLNDVVVFLVGEKDMQENPRFKIGKLKSGGDTYFQDYLSNQNNLYSHLKHGYLLVAPTIKGNNNVPASASEIRNKFKDANTKTELLQIMKQIFGWEDSNIEQIINDKLKLHLESFSKSYWSKNLFLEGGNVFGEVSPIKKEYIEPTLSSFIVKLSKTFPKKKNTFLELEKLGSAGKKDISGDIDLAYSVKHIFLIDGTPDFDGWGVNKNKYNELVTLFSKRSKTASPEKIQLRAMIELIGEKLMTSFPDIDVDTKSSGSGTLFCSIPQYNEKNKLLSQYVQTDINIGNLEWLKFAYYSNTYSGNVKGLHRTQLMLALFANKEKIFGHSTGVVDKNTRESLAQNPKQAINLLNKLYNFNITQEILNDYFKLEQFLKSNLDKNEYNAIIDRYLKILDSTRCDIPENLQNYWKQSQNRLDLKGKFLPADSALIKYQKLTEIIIKESGSAGGNRINRQDVDNTVKDYISKVLNGFVGYSSSKISGSYNTGVKNDFGDIDLIVTINGADKKSIKQELSTYFKSLPDDIIIPFKSEKYNGKKFLNTGEIVTVLFPIKNKSGEFVQIDNIISLNEEEMEFKKSFLDYPAEIQGLLLGIAKVILLEESTETIFHRLGINVETDLASDEEFEFNLSSVALTLRKVQLGQGFKELSRQEIWKTTNWNIIKKLFFNFDINSGFLPLLKDIKKVCKNPRSINRIKGIFKSMISIKSGEINTPKGNNKQNALDIVEKL